MPGEGLPSRRAHALDIVPQKEVRPLPHFLSLYLMDICRPRSSTVVRVCVQLLSMERRVFGEMFEREGLGFDSDSEMLPPLVTIVRCAPPC